MKPQNHAELRSVLSEEARAERVYCANTRADARAIGIHNKKPSVQAQPPLFGVGAASAWGGQINRVNGVFNHALE
jgi:hypothetical protein